MPLAVMLLVVGCANGVAAEAPAAAEAVAPVGAATGDVPVLSVLEKLALLAALQAAAVPQAGWTDELTAPAASEPAAAMVAGMIEIEPGVWVPDDGEGGTHLAAMRAPREPKRAFDFVDFDEIDAFGHMAFHVIAEHRGHDKHLGPGGVDRGLHLHPDDFFECACALLARRVVSRLPRA